MDKLKEINNKLVELGKRRDGVWQRQVTELLNLIEEYADNDFTKVNRLEIIDFRPCKECSGQGIIKRGKLSGVVCKKCEGAVFLGRQVIVGGPVYGEKDNVNIKASVQDDGRTLKLFIDPFEYLEAQ